MRSSASSPIAALGCLLLCASLSTCSSDNEAKDRNYGTGVGKDFTYPADGWGSSDAAASTSDAGVDGADGSPDARVDGPPADAVSEAGAADATADLLADADEDVDADEEEGHEGHTQSVVAASKESGR